MSVATPPAARAAAQAVAPPPVPLWRLSVEQYHRMVSLGILTEDDPVELLEGRLVAKMPKNSPHRLSIELTRAAIARLLPPGWCVDTQEPNRWAPGTKPITGDVRISVRTTRRR